MSTARRRACRRDASEPDVVEAFLDGGATVVKHSGPDEADLVVGYRGRTRLVEVKTGNEQLRPGQKAWAESWQGGKVEVVRNAAQARCLMRRWTAEALTVFDHADDLDPAPSTAGKVDEIR